LKIKKILLLLLLLGALSVVYFFIRPFWRLPFDRLSAFEAISSTTGLVIGFDVLDQGNDSLLKDQLWALDVQGLKQMLDSFDMAQDQIWESWWMIPKQLEQEGEMTYTFIGEGSSDFADIWNHSTLGTPMNFGDGKVFGFGVDSPDPIYFTRVHNLFIAGKYPFQIEETLSLLEHKKDTWQANDSFKTLNSLKKEKEVYSIILKCDELDISVPDYWMPKSRKKELNEKFDWIWLELGQADSLGKINAYLVPKSSMEAIATTAGDWQWIPDICQSARPLYFSKNSVTKEWITFIQPWIGEEGWQLKLVDNVETTHLAEEIWVLPIADTATFHQQYTALLREIKTIDELDYQSFQLKQLENTPLFNPLTDRKGLQAWVCEVDGALICAVSPKELQRWLDYYMVGGSIDKETDFLLQQQLLNKNKRQLLERWPPLPDKETNLFKLFYPNTLWANSGQLLVDIEIDNNALLHLKGSIKPYQTRIIGPTIAWTLPLQMKGELDLFPVKNINTDETIAIVVQNEQGYLTFLDKNANVFWERGDVAPLTGALYAIPWHNDLIHLLAASKDSLYLWDENGAAINIFPKMSAPLISPLCIAHFGNKETASIFVATASGEIWGLDTKGKQLEGWPIQFEPQNSRTAKILHHQLPTTDLMTIWADSAGWLGFNRQGEAVFETKALPQKTISLPFGQQLTDDGLPLNNRLVIVYENGVAQIVSFTGQTFNLPLGKGPVDHFLFTPLWGDPRADYIVQRGQLVHLFGYENEQLTERWQHYFSNVPDTLIDIAPYGLIVQNDENKEIWLLDANGQLMSDFPLAGQKSSILLNTSDQKHLLVTLLDNQLYAYQLSW